MDKTSNRKLSLFIGITTFISLIILVIIVWKIPRLQVPVEIEDAKEKTKLENELRSTLVQAIGGAFFFVTAYFTWRNLQTTEKNYLLAEDKQVTERFSKAVEMLAHDKLEVRVGGIYSLERISRDSKEDYWSIIEILASFLRITAENNTDESQSQSPVSQDIQAALTVIRRRDFTNDLGILNLGSTDLSNADLSGAYFKGAYFKGADLKGADLKGADLSFANFDEVSLEGAKLNLIKDFDNTSLKNITWNNETKWPKKEIVEKANNIPDGLKQELGI